MGLGNCQIGSEPSGSPVRSTRHIPGHLGQLGPDPEVLGAAPLALAAAVAQIGPFLLVQPLPLPPGDLPVRYMDIPFQIWKLPGMSTRRTGIQ